MLTMSVIRVAHVTYYLLLAVGGYQVLTLNTRINA